MSWYTDGRSMRGSGIFSETVEYDAFTCEDFECLQTNKAGIATTDDWGYYSVECQFCGAEYLQANIRQEETDEL